MLCRTSRVCKGLLLPRVPRSVWKRPVAFTAVSTLLAPVQLLLGDFGGKRVASLPPPPPLPFPPPLPAVAIGPAIAPFCGPGMVGAGRRAETFALGRRGWEEQGWPLCEPQHVRTAATSNGDAARQCAASCASGQLLISWDHMVRRCRQVGGGPRYSCLHQQRAEHLTSTDPSLHNGTANVQAPAILQSVYRSHCDGAPHLFLLQAH